MRKGTRGEERGGDVIVFVQDPGSLRQFSRPDVYKNRRHVPASVTRSEFPEITRYFCLIFLTIGNVALLSHLL